jgi:hypothetical protein
MAEYGYRRPPKATEQAPSGAVARARGNGQPCGTRQQAALAAAPASQARLLLDEPSAS